MKIAGVDVKELKEKFGTPLYVYDEAKIEEIMTDYLTNFQTDAFDTEVIYASKALSIKELLRMVKHHNMSLDVVSLGELCTAEAVDFDMRKVYYHGNNKSYTELQVALAKNVGCIVIDNLMELEDLVELTQESGQKVDILIRLNVGVEAHTHKFIVTAHVDSKFGVAYGSEDYLAMLKLIQANPQIHLLGFHSHIGSQIFDMEAFKSAMKKLIDICKDFTYPLVLNIGGGFGVHYTDDDAPVPVSQVCKTLIAAAQELLVQSEMKIKKLCIEPGRSIVAESGYTLYTIGNMKQTPNKLYYFIDGGMTDNIRPALYQALYDCDIVGKEQLPKNKSVTIGGKCCESGDIIIENTQLPQAEKGDLLVVYTTGAYGYSMSSNYNKAITPAVVFCKDGESKLVVKRQSYKQLLEREI